MNSFINQRLTKLEIPVGIAWQLASVMESKGKQELYENQKPEILATLREIALIQSAESSNRIEGVVVDKDRLSPLVLGKASPRDRSEEEIVGYRNALNWIHTSHSNTKIEPETVLNLHKMAQGASGDAGQWKNVKNEIIEILPDGRRIVRFDPVSPEETPHYVEQLCVAYRHILNQGVIPPLLASANFVFDFLCIHPFRDGNGRVSRLITLLLLCQHDLRVGRYVGLERIVEESKESYYEALAKSSMQWHEGKHDLTPWWSYFLGVIKSAYKEFEESVEQLPSKRGAKSEIIISVIARLPHEFTIAEVERQCPSVSREMIRNVIRNLRDEGKLLCTGMGRGAHWRKVGNK